MNSFFSKRITLCFFYIIIISCTSNQNAEKTVTQQETKSSQLLLTIDTFYNDYAAIISGLKPLKYFQKLSENKLYNDVVLKIEQDWKNIVNEKLNPINKWSDSVVKPKINNNNMFYPFAGADFLYLNAFFKSSVKASMFGLEPVGILLKDTANEPLMVDYIKKTFNALYFSNKLGFFRTNSMKTQLNQKEVNGTLPLLLFYIKRSGYMISKISYYNINEKGDFFSTTFDKSICTKINYFNENNILKELTYFSYDLSNTNLKKNPSMVKHLSSYQNCGVFLKAASYLLHLSEFSDMNALILKQSFILQDESGVTYLSYNNAKWNCTLFGTYNKTIDLFKHKFQPSLEKAYNVKSYSLPFMIGYNVSHNESNLQFIVKKSTTK